MTPLTDFADSVPRRAHAGRGEVSHYWLGVDGGGTNCRAEIYHAPAVPLADFSLRRVGQGRADAANFHRVGLESAVNSVRKAVNEACREAGVTPAQIHAACIGLAGVQHPKHHRQMMDALAEVLPIPDISLETDARVALAGATGLQPGVVIIAGTGSIACGTNARGEFARAGGWGPTMGDEGSGYYIGRRALEAAMADYDQRAEPTALTERVCRHFGVASPAELPSVIYNSSASVMREIAQLSRAVVESAREFDGGVGENPLRRRRRHQAFGAAARSFSGRLRRRRVRGGRIGARTAPRRDHEIRAARRRRAAAVPARRRGRQNGDGPQAAE
jgi:N-acetylglucosamine kinase-like BadF-type ATPase